MPVRPVISPGTIFYDANRCQYVVTRTRAHTVWLRPMGGDHTGEEIRRQLRPDATVAITADTIALPAIPHPEPTRTEE